MQKYGIIHLVCIADSSVLCGSPITILARHCANNAGWYTILLLIFPMLIVLYEIRFGKRQISVLDDFG